MVAKIRNESQSMPKDWQTQPGDEYIGCSVGIMAQNEEANIGRTIRAVLEQQAPSVRLEEVIVVASGCRDRTIPIALEMALQEPRRGREVKVTVAYSSLPFALKAKHGSVTVSGPLVEEQ